MHKCLYCTTEPLKVWGDSERLRHIVNWCHLSGVEVDSTLWGEVMEPDSRDGSMHSKAYYQVHRGYAVDIMNKIACVKDDIRCPAYDPGERLARICDLERQLDISRKLLDLFPKPDTKTPEAPKARTPDEIRSEEFKKQLEVVFKQQQEIDKMLKAVAEAQAENVKILLQLPMRPSSTKHCPT